METPAIFKLPPLPNIIRAGCPDVQPRRGGYFSYMQPLDWSNYLASYLWNFSNVLSSNFPYMFFDMRYGYILFRDHTDALDASDYGQSFSSYSFPAYTYLPGGELTYNSTGLATNIDGTEYTKTPWDSDVVEYEFTGQTKDGNLWKYTPSDKRTSWNEAWTEMLAATPVVNTTATTVYVGFYWRYNGYEWTAGKRRGYISFDTSSLSGKTITSATLKIYLGGSIWDFTVISEDTINIYQKAWNTLDTGDWDGGTLAGSWSTFNYNDWNEIDIETSLINKTGETQFELIYKGDADGYVPADPYPSTLQYGGGYKRFWSGEQTGEEPTLVIEASG